MPDLPYDVWHLIAQYLAWFEIHRLMSINRVSLNLAMDKKYKTIKWVHDGIVVHLKRLQDPYVAARVRRLHIRTWFLQYLFQREELFEMTAKHYGSAIFEVKKRFAKLLGRPPPHAVVAASRNIAVTNRLGKLSSSKNLLKSMTKAIAHMINITEYEFEWGDLVLNTRQALS
ncbi:hypothetical protein H0H87_000792 [Tephrocybe sp. NHM501043]|nr:hypothetical protein H0H87_000792 [Tephrocybe sp. NHM501043]